MNLEEKRETKRNPQETSNFVSSMFFGWTAPIFWKGAKRNLVITDLYDPLKSDESERLGDLLQREWENELTRADRDLVLGKDAKKRKPNLMWAIIRMFWAPYMLQGVILFFRVSVLRVVQPVIQGWVIGYFKKGENDLVTRDQVLIYAGFLVIVNLLIVFVTHHNSLGSRQIGMRVRVACCSILYRKLLRLDQTAVTSTAAGQVTNLMSNDVARFDMMSTFLHFIWIMPIQVCCAGWVMWRSAGIAALVGIGAMLMQTIPLQGYLSSLSASLRSKIAVKTDERVQLMSELISGIKVVKMYSWEKPFEAIVSKVRALEMRLIKYVSYLRGFYIGVAMLSERVALYLTLMIVVLMGNPPSPEITFVLANLFHILQFTCAVSFPHAIIMVGETAVSTKRLTEFLLLDEVGNADKVVSKTNNGLRDAEGTATDHEIKHGVGIEMIEVAANWIYGHLPSTLSGISMEVRSRSLCVVVGPVGAGKSSLLHLVLGELPVGAGRLSLFTGENGQTKIASKDIRISYTSQDPWLFSASIRDNILFGQPYDERRYQEVTRVCALLEDFEQLPRGDLTLVGERGASLSGGQRARVNLARAVYKDAELYLLDDPLSAVDPRVGRHLFEECITGFLEGKTRILVTHQLQYLRNADTVVVLNRGTLERQGSYAELAESNFRILDSDESEEPTETKHTIANHEGSYECQNEAVTADEDDRLSDVTENSEPHEHANEEETATGSMSSRVYRSYFLAGGNICSLVFLAIIFTAGQLSFSVTDYWLSYWTNQEAVRFASQSEQATADGMGYRNVTERDREEGNTEWFDEYGLVRPNLAIYIYTACIASSILLVILRSMLFMRIAVRASREIHDSMFANLLQATMRFFNTNPSGRILNRFSKDMGAMDEQLPKTMLEALQILTIMAGVLVMVAVVNNWMILPAIVVGGIFHLVRIYYLRTAQDVKRLEGITKSPVFSHVSSTLDGLTTIRSRGTMMEGMLRREFDRYQDTHTGAWYLSIATASAFGLFLDMLSCVFIAFVCFSFILLDDGDTLPGFVGLAISQSLILTGTIQFGIRQSTEVISQMTAVERVLQYTNLPKEGPFTTDNPPPPTWPSKGGLVFKNVFMRYADGKPPVLKSLNLDIKPGWKVGIVGRTGAGKSSLISALFSLTGDGLEGEIVLDGIDTKSIGLHELRPRISIIPQEPILFSASLRHNLDPFEQYSDAELWDSLREVELGDSVPSLDFHVAGGGANFSVGQRQLICLARAILRNNRVLVLDEATANVDRRTDSLIQNTIRRRFADCTVLTIAHRLNTIMDSDRVLVMAGGRVVEFGHPHLLLKNREGHFSQMLQKTGKKMAEKLAAIAESGFLMNSEFEEETIDGRVNTTDRQITHL